jgi:hypothetical protein
VIAYIYISIYVYTVFKKNLFYDCSLSLSVLDRLLGGVGVIGWHESDGATETKVVVAHSERASELMIDKQHDASLLAAAAGSFRVDETCSSPTDRPAAADGFP